MCLNLIIKIKQISKNTAKLRANSVDRPKHFGACPIGYADMPCHARMLCNSEETIPRKTEYALAMQCVGYRCLFKRRERKKGREA